MTLLGTVELDGAHVIDAGACHGRCAGTGATMRARRHGCPKSRPG